MDERDARRLPSAAIDILERTTDGFLALDGAWRLVHLNRRAAEKLGGEAEDLIGRVLWEAAPRVAGGRLEAACHRARREQVLARAEERLDAADRWLEHRVHPWHDGVMVFSLDVTDQRHAREQLMRSEKRYRTLAYALSSVVFTTDGTGRPVGDVRQWERLTGHARWDEVTDWLEVVHPDDRERIRAAWDAARAAGAEYDEQYRMVRPDGGWRHVHARGVPIIEHDGSVREWVGALVDVSERQRADAALRRAALVDGLTGLANRGVFLDRLGRLLQRRAGPCAAVLYVDLDHFKAINDEHGHATGDAVIREAADRLRAAVRPSDTVARLSGDEFAVLCEELPGEDEALRIAERLVASLDQSARARGTGRDARVTASVGVAFVHGSHTTADQVLSDADTAMYEAKARGGARLQVFDADLRARLDKRRGIERLLRHGLDDGGPALRFQPIFDMALRRAPAVEALLRWKVPGGGLLGADAIVPVAEATGLIVPIGVRVLEEACRTAAGWPDGMVVAVNLSARQLADPARLVAAVGAVLDATGLAPARLRLEITESVLMDDADLAERTLLQLRDLGVQLALDDFGKGYSSLAYLHRLPFDVLKVDRSFVAGLPGDRGSARIVEAVVGLARGLDLTVVAEGVERDEQLSALRDAGCDAVQGFLFSPPVASEDLAAALHLRSPASAAAAPRPT